MKKILPFLFLLVFLIGIVSPLDDLGTFPSGEVVRITQVCSEATYINISSISNPNSTAVLSNIIMSPAGSGEYYFDFDNTTINGRYDVRGISDGCEGEFATYFTITPNGNSFGQAEGLAAVGILLGALLLTFFFAYIGTRLGENDKLAILGFLFMVLSIILAIYSLYLGWVYSYEIVIFESLSNVSLTMFRVFLWILIGVVVISMALMLIAFIKELSTVSKQKNFGEGFNPITDTYDF